MKALDKDRRRRYETANDFATDVMNYLADRPVAACPPSARYRFAKYARRHRATLTTGVLVGLALIAGTAVSTWQAILATRAKNLANQRESETKRAAAEYSAVTEFLIQDLLAAAAPEKTLGRDVTVVEVLAKAEKKIDTAFPDQPLIEAGVRDAMASAFSSLGRFDTAQRHLSRSLDLRLSVLGSEHRETLSSMCNLAIPLLDRAKYDEARKLLEQSLEIQRRTLGAEDPDTLSSMACLGQALGGLNKFDEARKLDEQTLEIRRRVLGADHPDTLGSMI
jgi:tetratricopeptide (TPR) repeat protein